MLEEVATEGVAGGLERLVAGADPAPALDEGVLAVEGGGGEVVVEGCTLNPSKPSMAVLVHCQTLPQIEEAPLGQASTGQDDAKRARLMLPGPPIQSG